MISCNSHQGISLGHQRCLFQRFRASINNAWRFCLPLQPANEWQGSRRGIEIQIGWGMKPEMLFLVDWSQRNQTSTVQIDIQQQNTAGCIVVFCGLSWSWSMHAFWFSQFWRISRSLLSYPFFMGKERERRIISTALWAGWTSRFG